MTAPRQHMFTVETIEKMLLDRIEVLARELAPDGERRGAEWVAINPCRADTKLGSFSINLHSGRWADFAADKRSSRSFPCLSLVAMLATNGEWGTKGGTPGCVRWARDWLGLTDHGISPAARQKLDAETQRAKQIRDDEDRTRNEHKRKAAQAMWLNAKPLDGADPASRYLRARGIDVTTLPEGIPGALRFDPTCRHYAGEHGYTEHPAMLAAMHLEGAPQGFAAVHRTYLAPDPRAVGAWMKAFGRNSKKILGAKSGATIRLTKGPTLKPLASALEGEWIGIAEGIENALSAVLATATRPLSTVTSLPGLRILAAATLENIGKAQLPSSIGGVYLIADNDAFGSEAELALERAANGLADREIDIAIVRAPDGFKDFNDALTGKRMGAN